MDYSHPVAALIPGVQGRVLEVLAATEAELTMRTVARLAAVSPNRATSILNQLIDLGLVERREAGTAALVRLCRDNEAARLILQLAGLPETVRQRLAETAHAIVPAPASVTLFGSFARGHAVAGSDVDILVVRPAAVTADDAGWTDALGRWSDSARRIAGNPVNLVVVSETEVPRLARRQRSVWAEIASDVARAA
jgi:predicted nucleotidyltransferase